jgi:hypothetical protein
MNPMVNQEQRMEAYVACEKWVFLLVENEGFLGQYWRGLRWLLDTCKMLYLSFRFSGFYLE